MLEMERAAFEDLVSTALDRLPPELTALMDNVAVFVEDDPPPGQYLLGLYEGVPLTERTSSYLMTLPDRITVFRRPALASCDTEDELERQVQITVVHEIAHHFGIDDARLHALGYG